MRASSADSRSSDGRELLDGEYPLSASPEPESEAEEHGGRNGGRNGAAAATSEHTSSAIASDDDDDADESEDEDDSDDDEPALKYEKLGSPAAELLEKDSASAIAIHNKTIALGTHNGVVHIFDFAGKRIKSYRPHSSSVLDIVIDTTGDFVATASMDGQVVIHSITTPEAFSYDFRRPMRTIALEPNFGKRTSRAYVSGGMAGTLILHEKGWLGHTQHTLSADEGPIWLTRWRGTLIAWANDLGVKIYDTASQSRVAFIDRPKNSPRADLFKCSFYWQDDTTLLIAWADYIKIARIRSRVRQGASAASLSADVTAVFQVDCMVAGIVPHVSPISAGATTPSSFLVLAYVPPDETFGDEALADSRRRAANMPELRIISRAGEELSSDALPVVNYHLYGCNDYALVEADGGYVVLSPKNIVIARPRDQRDHVDWLVDKGRYEEALQEVEKMGDGKLAMEIGVQYVRHLVDEGEFEKAAAMCPKVHSQNPKQWEDWVYIFAHKRQLHTIIPYVPTAHPRLGRQVYGLVLGHFLTHDHAAALRTIKLWPSHLYDIPAVIESVHSELDSKPKSANVNVLMECLAELYMANRQPGKALIYYLRLRRPNVFDLIREHNLFTSVQDQALLLVEFDQELITKRKAEGETMEEKDHGAAIKLLVDHTHSIPVVRVVQQLEVRPDYLFMYLDSLYDKDPYLTSDYADRQLQLYSEYAPSRLIDFLRTSNYYGLEKAYNICKEKDLVPEMVFLLGKMGDNKKALTLIIERLGDVHRAIDFAKEQNDNDLWEDLLRYSETRPAFIRGLLENVGGAEINPIRLIRRIKNGLEIPGLKDALIKILHDFNLQISLLEGCQAILHSDSTDLSGRLQKSQTAGFFLTTASTCQLCGHALHRGTETMTLMFLCRHVVHASCVSGTELLVGGQRPEAALALNMGMSLERSLAAKISFMVALRSRMDQGCPVCYKLHEGAQAP